jgi:hypothetical protein
LIKKDVFDPQDDVTNFQQKIEIEDLVFEGMRKIHSAAYEGDEDRFANAVESLLLMLPKENIKRIEENKEAYITTIEQPVYKYSCGHQMGSVENPVYINKKSDWNYDPNINGGKPVLVSPIMTEVTQIDYKKLYRLILAELESIGVTWKTEPRDRVEKRVKMPPTPLLTLSDGSSVRVLIKRGLGTDVILQNTPELEPEPLDSEEFEGSEEVEEDWQVDE